MSAFAARCAAGILVVLSASTIAQSDGLECKKSFPNLVPDPGIKGLGFGPRSGDQRCEGFFVAPVAGEPMALVRMTVGSIPSDAEEVMLSAVVPRDIHVRAVALTEATFYRMEGEIPAQKSFHWPLRDVVKASSGLQPSDLGVYGWFERDGETVYTPVKVSAGTAAPQSTAPVKLLIRANIAFDEILYQPSDRSDCRPSGPSWTRAGQYVRSGGLVPISPEQRTVCLLLRGRTENSDSWRHLTVRLALR
jgi:hypothetical protein